MSSWESKDVYLRSTLSSLYSVRDCKPQVMSRKMSKRCTSRITTRKKSGIEDTNSSTTLLSVENLRVCKSQMNYINFQSVYLERKSMSHTGNSLTNHGKKLNITKEIGEIFASGALDHKSIRYSQNSEPPCIWSEPSQIDPVEMNLISHARVRTEEFLNKTNQTIRESDIINFESNFFQDVPEEDEVPINFEILGPIPDLVDLYNFDVPKEAISSTMERQSSPKPMVLTLTLKIDEEVISSPVDLKFLAQSLTWWTCTKPHWKLKAWILDQAKDEEYIHVVMNGPFINW